MSAAPPKERHLGTIQEGKKPNTTEEQKRRPGQADLERHTKLVAGRTQAQEDVSSPEGEVEAGWKPHRPPSSQGERRTVRKGRGRGLLATPLGGLRTPTPSPQRRGTSPL